MKKKGFGELFKIFCKKCNTEIPYRLHEHCWSCGRIGVVECPVCKRYFQIRELG